MAALLTVIFQLIDGTFLCRWMDLCFNYCEV